MRIAVTSDVHLEFGPLILKNEHNIDVLVLSGDICVASDLNYKSDNLGIVSNGKYERMREFFRSCSDNFKNVIYIMGNHEHYHGDFNTSTHMLRSFLMNDDDYSNIHFLDKESVEIDGVTFVGGTLWTDFNGGDEMTMRYIERRMNDFRIVSHSGRKVSYKEFDYAIKEDGTKDYNTVVRTTFRERDARFCPADAYEDYKQMLEVIKTSVADHTKKYVVCTHHAPSKASTHPRYAHEVEMNWGYSSNQDEFILNNPQIKLWTHGHTHEDFDYMIGSTRIFCNPRGYDGYEERADRFELKFVDI